MIDAIEELVSSYAAEHHCPTVAWGVVDHGRLIAAADEHTVYRIASMTKSFSAAATLWLRDRGILRLDDPIAVHSPGLASLRNVTADAPEITVRDLLAMTSGLATDDPWADRHLDLSDAEFDAIIELGALFAVPTGTDFEYSNFGFAVLGRVVEGASGRRLQEIVSTELLAPLGMSHTTWVRPDHDDWARPRRWDDGIGFGDELPPLADGLIAPMGGLWTTVADLARWVTWLDDGFPARDDADDGPLSRASRREMQTIQRYVGRRTLRGVSSPSGYGYGLRILDEPELGRVVTHSGGLPGYGSNMRWLSGRRIGVIALSNVTYAPMTELTARILDIVHAHGHGPVARRGSTPDLDEAAARLVALLNDWHDDAAEALFADNVAWDDPYDRRRTQAAHLIGDSGPLVLERLDVATAADATIVCIDAEGGRLTISFMLAPFLPARVQEYTLTRVEPSR